MQDASQPGALSSALAHLCRALFQAVAEPTLDGFVQQLRKEINLMALDIATTITQLQADVQAQTTVVNSVQTLMQGLSAQLAQAKADAQVAGATPDQLTSFDALDQAIKANTAALGQAVTANTPGAAPAAATPTTPVATAPAAAPSAPPAPVVAGP